MNKFLYWFGVVLFAIFALSMIGVCYTDANADANCETDIECTKLCYEYCDTLEESDVLQCFEWCEDTLLVEGSFYHYFKLWEDVTYD